MRQKGFLFVPLVIILLLTIVGYFIYLTSNLKNKESIYPLTPTIIPKTIDSNFKNCRVYPRRNMNVVGNDTLEDKSEVMCEVNGKNTAILEILDKTGFETAANSIYRFWKDADGYKALIVDQNGAGSGEGNGKIILLKSNSYRLLYCFYYTTENFSEGYYEALSDKEMANVKNKLFNTSNPECSNFNFKSAIN